MPKVGLSHFSSVHLLSLFCTLFILHSIPQIQFILPLALQSFFLATSTNFTTCFQNCALIPYCFRVAWPAFPTLSLPVSPHCTVPSCSHSWICMVYDSAMLLFSQWKPRFYSILFKPQYVSPFICFCTTRLVMTVLFLHSFLHTALFKLHTCPSVCSAQLDSVASMLFLHNFVLCFPSDFVLFHSVTLFVVAFVSFYDSPTPKRLAGV